MLAIVLVEQIALPVERVDELPAAGEDRGLCDVDGVAVESPAEDGHRLTRVIVRVEDDLGVQVAIRIGSDGGVGGIARAEMDRGVADLLRRAVVLAERLGAQAAVLGELCAALGARALKGVDGLLEIAHEDQRGQPAGRRAASAGRPAGARRCPAPRRVAARRSGQRRPGRGSGAGGGSQGRSTWRRRR